VGELAKFINARIAEPPARPKHVFLLDELPLTPFAKIARFRLRQLAVEHRANELVIGLLSGALVTCTDPAAKKIQIKSDAAITQGQLDEIEKALAKLDLQLAD
jgi:fatty-acyl-CoA synthase